MKVLTNNFGDKIMKKTMFACLCAAAMTSQGFAAAIEQAKFSYQESVIARCADEECAGVAKGNVTLTAHLLLENGEAAKLNNTAVITAVIAGIVVNAPLSADPDFQDGDRSARMLVPVEVTGDIISSATVILNWTDTELNLKVIDPYRGNLKFGPVIIHAIQTAQKAKVGDRLERGLEVKETKDVNAIKLSVSAANSMGIIFESEFEITGDYKNSELEFKSAEGNDAFKGKESFKSREVPL
jgi:hypothetical protein